MYWVILHFDNPITKSSITFHELNDPLIYRDYQWDLNIIDKGQGPRILRV